ncbi:MAG: hypothetical protein ACI9NT_002233, partial [Bacteroidia bacterium]
MTKSGRHLQLTTIPGMPAMLAKAALSRKQRQAEPVCQPLSITAVDIRPDASGLVAFNEVCSFV